MPTPPLTFITIDMVENYFVPLVADFFRDYPDPLPEYQYLDGERGRGLLESALAVPRQTFYRQYLHRTIYDKAAALWRSVTLNHPFIDGNNNKRMGFICCLAFLGCNGYLVIASQEAVAETCVSIAAGDPTRDVKTLSKWLRQYTIPIQKLALILQITASVPSYPDLLARIADE